MAKENFTPGWVYAIWAAAMAISIGIVGIVSHAPFFPAYLAGGGLWAIGIFIMLWQIIKGGDTTLAPYGVQTAGAVLFWILAASA